MVFTQLSIKVNIFVIVSMLNVESDVYVFTNLQNFTNALLYNREEWKWKLTKNKEVLHTIFLYFLNKKNKQTEAIESMQTTTRRFNII